MKHRREFPGARRCIGLALPLLLVTAAGHAGTVFYSDSLSETQVAGAVTIPLLFPQFDSSLGTLVSVGLEDSFTLTSQAFATGIMITNPTPPPAFFCIPGGSSNTATFAGITGTPESVTANANDPACTGMPMSQSQPFDVTSLLTGAAISGYIGTGQVSFSGQFYGGSGNQQWGSLTGFSKITYTYSSAAPEPGTLALAGVGAAMIAGAIRRRITRR
ncbi:MAG TPA: PEP-CTERM sorting domain-containing protein [Bryobacteraceae bacterium]|jgi:hypothetical protein|nr:PEP-CTERM sorting domain-containing protein [Bryobacteraceae bacterium]